MEWVETVGATLDEARERALDQLGVAEDEAEFEVLEEPRAGLFGRTRGNARVRARVRPTQPRPKVDRRGRRVRGATASGEERATDDSADQDADDQAPPTPRRRSGGRRAGGKVVSHVEDTSGERVKEGRSRARGGVVAVTSSSSDGGVAAEPALGSGSAGSTPSARQERTMTTEEAPDSVSAQQVADEASRFLEGLLVAFGTEGTVSSSIEGDEIDVQVTGKELGLLVGPRGTTLVAVQEVTRLASQRRLGDHETRLRVDVAGYRERRRVALAAFATKMADEVVTSKTARVLEPMSSPDRKVVHDTLAVRTDVVTRSEGDDPFRRVVISPAS